MLAFFVRTRSTRLGRTQLMKFLYLSDYEARRFLGRPISSIQYVWFHFGPYSAQLQDALAELRSSQLIVEESVEYPTGTQGYRYVDGRKEIAFDFDAGEIELLRYVCETYSTQSLQSLLDDVVYQTEPMLKAVSEGRKNQPLEMGIVDGIRLNELGVPYDELLRRKKLSEQGNRTAHEDVMSAARATLRDAAS